MSYATQRDAIARTRQDFVIVGVRECENFYATLVQQLLTQTEHFDHADWVKTSVTVTADSVVSPEGWSVDGPLTADKIDMNADNDAISQTPAVAVTSKAFSGSAFLKVATGATSQLVTIRVRNVAGTQIGSKQIVITDSWQRFFVHKLFTAVPVDNVVFEIIRIAGDATGTFYAWGANLWQNPGNVDRVQQFPYRKRTAEAVGTVSVNVSRCQAVDQGVGARCFYSRATCQDPDDFNAGNVYEIESPVNSVGSASQFFYPISDLGNNPFALDITGGTEAWSAVDDPSTGPNDADYVSTSNVNARFTAMRFKDPSYLSGVPLQIKFYIRAANAGAANRIVAFGTAPASNAFAPLINIPLGSGFTNYTGTDTVNPDTGLPLTFADIVSFAANGILLVIAAEPGGALVKISQFYWEPVGLSWVTPSPRLRGLREFNFCRKDGPLFLQGVKDISPSITDLTIATQELQPERALTVNERVTFEFEDDTPTQAWNIRQQGEGALVNTATGVGSFWRRWNTIYRGFSNPECYVIRKIGYVEAGQTEADFITRGTYLIHNFETDDRKIRLVCGDRLKLTRKNIPNRISDTNRLTLGLSSSATAMTVTDASAISTPAIDATAAVPSYIVTLELEPNTSRAEKVNVTAINLTTNIVTITRGRWGTTAVKHDNNVKFREVAEFGTEQLDPSAEPNGKNPIDIILEMYRYAGLLEREIDRATLISERDLWIPSVVSPPYGTLLRRTVIDVTDIETLVREIRELVMLFLWLDEDQLLTGRAFAPLLPSDAVPYTSLTEAANFVAGSLSVDENTESRVSRALVAYDLIPGETGDSVASYASARIEIDIDAEEREFYGQSKLKVVLSQWLKTGDTKAAEYFTSHVLSRFRQGVRIVTFRLEVRDDDIRIGDVVKVTTSHVQDAFGNALASQMWIMKKRQISDNVIEFDAWDSGIYQRYGFYAHPGAADYGTASASEKEHGYLGDTSGNVGTPKVPGYVYW